MSKISNDIQSIEDVKKQIIDTSLIVATAIGSLAYLVSLFRLITLGFHISFIINFVILLTLILVTLLRSRLTINLKIYLILSLIVLLSLFDVINFGLLSAARIYLILIPFFSILYMPFRRTLIVYGITILLFITVGFLHHFSVLSIPADYVPQRYVLELYPWIIIAVHISVVAIIILLVMRKFIITHTALISNLEIRVKDRTKDLEITNKKLQVTNKELSYRREELENALDNLQIAQKQLVQSEKMASLGVLAAGIAHEINNPLNFISGGAVGLESYISENLQHHSGELDPLIEGIQTGVRRVSDIITSLNRYSRHDNMPSTPCDIHAIIENCLVMLANQFKYKIKVRKTFTDHTYTLMCNEGKLHQAILNILLNAEQSIDIKGTIIISTSLVEDKLIISFTDSGCGISTENLSKITDPFFTTKDPGKGTGLGLFITYNIIQEYQGKLEFESNPGKGTTVIITLPVTNTEKP